MSDHSGPLPMNEEPLQDETNENLDYYAILGVSRTASTDDIKKSFKKLAITFHPDKFVDPERRVEAQSRFKQIKDAYDVLMNDNLRHLYDEFGAEAVKKQMNLQVGRPIKSPEEFLREMFRLRRTQHLAFIQRRINHTGNFMFIVNALDNRNRLRPEFATTSIRQSINFPLSLSSDLRLTFTGIFSGGSGNNSLKINYSKLFSAAVVVGYCTLNVGWKKCTFKIGASKQLSEKTHADLSVGIEEKTPKLRLSIIRSLGEKWAGTIEGSAGIAPSVKLILATRPEFTSYGFAATTAVKRGELSFSVKGAYEISERSSVSMEASVNNNLVIFAGERSAKVVPVTSWLVAGNAERTISQFSRAHIGFTIGSHGVYVTAGITRYGQTFSVPIMLSHIPSWKNALFAAFAPITIGYILEAILLEPRRRRKRIAQEAKKKKEREEQVAANKARAQADCRLMADEVARKREEEEAKGGLVIIHAFYGRHPDEADDLNEEEDNPYRVDVTLPLQYMVQGSQLQLNSEATKSALIGFYDPLPDEEKWIEVVYLFRHNVHRALVADHEPLRMPLQSHKMD